MERAKGTMPANRTLQASETPSTEVAGGIVSAPVGPRGKWGALRALRSAMSDLRQTSGDPHVSFVVALARDGRIVSGRDPEAATFLLGYTVP